MSRSCFPRLAGILLVGAAGCASNEPLAATSPSPVDAMDDGYITERAGPSGDVAGASVTSAQPADMAAIQESLMARWNAVADLSVSAFSFHWASFDQFPHPTYKGGSGAAYRGFADVLLAFFERGDDFDFLVRNHLFTLSLVYVFPSGANGLDTSFKDLAASFASANGFGDIPVETRNTLQSFLSRMQ